MRPHLVVLLGLSLLLALTACVTPSTVPSPVTPTMHASGAASTALPRHSAGQRDVAYGPLAGETLNICQPQGAAGLRPGVILLHGGGWTAGDKSEYTAEYTGLCPFLAGRGMVAAALNYRLTPYNTWPAPLVDAQLAVRYLRANAGPSATRRPAPVLLGRFGWWPLSCLPRRADDQPLRAAEPRSTPRRRPWSHVSSMNSVPSAWRRRCRTSPRS